MAQEGPNSGLVVRIEGLRNQFGQQVVHHNLDFGVERGEALSVVFREIGRETVKARGAEISATKIVVSGDLERELWYGEDGFLVHLRLIGRDGSTISYELQ